MRTRSFMSAPAPFVSLPATVIFSLLLSGCLASKVPLITAANSDRPFPSHSLLKMNDPPGSAAVDLAGDNSYIVSPLPSGDAKPNYSKMRLYFKKLSENTYAYSRREDDEDSGTKYAYGYMRVLGDNALTYDEPLCTDLDRAELEKLGVEITKPNGDKWTPALCEITSVEVLEALLRSYLNDPKNAEKIKHSPTQSTMRIMAK